MGLRDIFLKGVETIFNVMNDAVKTGSYNVDTDDGFDDATTTTDLGVRCIFENYEAKDVELLTFSKLIQPQDIIALMPAVDLVNCEMNTQGYFIFDFDGKRYTVEGHDLDPMNVIYTLLLRKN